MRIRILDRYVAVNVIVGSLAMLLIMVSLEMVLDFIDASGDVGHAGQTFGYVVVEVLLSAPYRAYQAFPFATLVGSLFSMGGMAARSELVVMRAAGVSVLGISRAVLGGGLILALAAMALGEWAVPPAQQYSKQLEAAVRTDRISAFQGGGFWARDGDRFVHVGTARSARLLQQVDIYAFDRSDPQRLRQIIHAAKARFGGDGQWQLSDVTVSDFADSGRVTSDHRKSMPWTSDLRPDVLDVVVVDPRDLSISELSTYIGYLQRNHLESDQYRLAFWLKLATPLAVLVMLLLPVPLAFGSLRNVGAGQRIFVGVIIGVAFFLLNRALNYIGLIYGFPPFLSAMLPPLIFLAAGLFFAARVR